MGFLPGSRWRGAGRQGAAEGRNRVCCGDYLKESAGVLQELIGPDIQIYIYICTNTYVGLRVPKLRLLAVPRIAKNEKAACAFTHPKSPCRNQVYT